MSRRSRKRHSKKKQSVQAQKDNGSVLDKTGTDDTLLLLNTNHVAGIGIDNNTTYTIKNRFLDIVIKIIKNLQSGYDLSQLHTVMENLLAISNSSFKKRNLTLQILHNLISNVDGYEDDDELKILQKELESKFLTSELRELLIDENALKTSFISALLGGGNFGTLLKGGSKIKVAIKQKDNVYYGEQIIQEAKIMAKFNHKNILKILAFERSGPRFAVEYMPLGNLWDALHVYTFSDSKLVDILREVASGMKYISSKDYLHRNLRCKNILLDADGKCKISNFGLCQYVGDTQGVYEDKEMEVNYFHVSPETNKTHKFTTKTDVWAMGLLAWKMFYIAEMKQIKGNPLLDDRSDDLLWIFLLQRLANYGFPPPLWNYFNEKVLNKDPRKRPTFASIEKKLDMFQTEG